MSEEPSNEEDRARTTLEELILRTDRLGRVYRLALLEYGKTAPATKAAFKAYDKTLKQFRAARHKAKVQVKDKSLLKPKQQRKSGVSRHPARSPRKEQATQYANRVSADVAAFLDRREQEINEGARGTGTAGRNEWRNEGGG